MPSRDLSKNRVNLEAHKIVTEVAKRQELAANVDHLPEKVAKKVKTIPRIEKN